MNIPKILLLPIFFFLTSCNNETHKMTTSADKKNHILENHGDKRVDNYYWMRDDSRDDPKVINYLKNENQLSAEWFDSNFDYQTEIVKDLIDQVPDEELSFPIKNINYQFYQKLYKDSQLPLYFFQKDKEDEKLYLNPNIKLQKQEYYSIGAISPSPDNSLIAYTEDNNGRREYVIKIIDTSTLKHLNDTVTNASYDVVWSNDNKSIIYLKKDPITLIKDSVYVHRIGTPEDEDILIYKEVNTEFNINLYKSKTKKYAYIDIDSTNSNEIRLIDLNNPLNEPFTFIDRSKDHLYYLEHIKKEEFLIRTNMDAPNFKVLKSSSLMEDFDNLKVVIEHDDKIFINDTLLVGDNLILEVRKFGLPEITIHNLSTSESYDIEFKENAYDVNLSNNTEVTSDNFIYQYSSLTSPKSILNYNLVNKESKNLLSKKINGFDKSKYISDRFFIDARDSEKIPIITVAHKDTDLNKAPILFYGYGSYGINVDAHFRESLVPLLNRGFVFAIINIRGGGEMGKKWYENGRMFNKMNTFYDFNDGVKEVLKMGIGNPRNVFARGGSAGGLLMGAIINLEPELYKGILSGVPFVDVLTTMSDPSIPLTTFEYNEWGNPANFDEYFYMKKYSPYDNIDKLNYPAIFITSSLYDSQVQYFEPAKYVAKLKEYNQSDNPILMKMNLIGGHGGMSGKINQFEEIAEEYTFILNLID
jgi:oligopeptidase B